MAQQPGGGQQCPFCALVASPDQTFDVHESEHFKAWLDINPRARGHTMIVPKEHQTSMDELGPALLQELMDVIRVVGEKARNGLGATGVSIVLNDGESAGQRLDHFYTQVFPRFPGEENEGAPAGAVFQPIDELDENTLSEIAAAMEDATFRRTNASKGGPGTQITRKNRGEADTSSEDTETDSDEPADGSWDGTSYHWDDDGAEFT